jgi:hypothetical protein
MTVVSTCRVIEVSSHKKSLTVGEISVTIQSPSITVTNQSLICQKFEHVRQPVMYCTVRWLYVPVRDLSAEESMPIFSLIRPIPKLRRLQSTLMSVPSINNFKTFVANPNESRSPVISQSTDIA